MCNVPVPVLFLITNTACTKVHCMMSMLGPEYEFLSQSTQDPQL